MKHDLIDFLKKEWILLLLCAIYLGGMLCVYPSLPDQIPTSFNFRGEIQNYTQKKMFIINIFLPIILYVVITVMPLVDPRRRNYDKFKSSYGAIKIILLVVFISLNGIGAWAAITPDFPVSKAIMGMMFLMIFAMGNYLTTVKQTYFIGIRTPWALDSEENWRLTHQLGGRLWVVGGLLGFVLMMLSLPILAWVVFGCAMVIPVIYSFALYKKGI